MATTDKLKQSLYFPEDMLREIMFEANRLDRSLSWAVQQAWRLARENVQRFPAVNPGAEPAPAHRTDREPQRRVDPEQRAPSAQVYEFIRGKFDRELTS